MRIVGKKRRRKLSAGSVAVVGVVVLVLFLLVPAGTLQALPIYHYPFQVFTADSGDFNNPEINMYMTVSNGFEKVDFTFYNISSIPSSLARIYFDDGLLLGIADVINGPGTSFGQVFPGPGNVPNAGLLDPPFVADREFSIGAEPPIPENGVNPPPPNEWVQIKFDLESGGTLEGVIAELDSGVLRVAIHIINLPDGSSESAIAVPEPTTMALLALGTAVLLRIRKR